MEDKIETIGQSSNTVAHTKSSIYDIFYATKTKQTYVNLGISILLIIVFIIFALAPTIQTITTSQAKIDTYKKLNSAVEKKIANAKKLESQRSTSGGNGLKDQISFLNKSYLYSYNLLPIYDNLQTRAVANNIKISSVSPKVASTTSLSIGEKDTISNPPSSVGYDVSISVEAQNMTSLIAFIKSIEGYNAMPLFSRVRTYSITDNAQLGKVSTQSTPTSAQANTTVTATVDILFYIDTSRSN